MASSEKSHKIRKRTTIRDVARLAQVAPITVSRVVNNLGYISPETRLRVETAIQELNYIPNALAQSLRHQKTNMVALLVTDIINPFWTTVARGVEDACSQQNVSVILCNTDEEQDKLDNYIRLLLQRQIDGLILVPTEGYDGPMLDNLVSGHVPVILLDRTLPHRQGFTVVRSNNRNGGELLTRHLLALGHRRIMMLAGSPTVSTSAERVEGYCRALGAAGLSDAGLIRFGRLTQASGYEMTLDLLRTVQPRPTAIVTANNLIAYGAQRALDEWGIGIPEAMSLATFDDLPPPINPRPFLTSVAQNPYRMGLEAAQRLITLLEIADAPPIQDVVLPVELLVRESTAAPGTHEPL